MTLPPEGQQPQPPQQPAPPAPGYLQQPGYVQQPQGGKTNTLAIVAFISSFFVHILGIILGHIALSQIKRSGEGGRGLALAGTIIGYVLSFGWILILAGMFFFGSMIAATVAATDWDSTVQSMVEELDEDTDGFFTDDDFTHDDFTQDEFAQGPRDPWVGTELEAFCTVYMGEIDEGQELRYLQDVATSAPTPELQERWNELAEYLEREGDATWESDEFFGLYDELDWETWDLCVEAG